MTTRSYNPYYLVVDPAGNQLPYIETVVGEIVAAETYDLRIISGEHLFWIGTVARCRCRWWRRNPSATS